MDKKIIVIGGGIGGLGVATMLAKKGAEVILLEKNDSIGGKARVFKVDGYTFDMGPSWYMMPDIFEHYFSLVGEDINSHLSLSRLAPSYRVFLKSNAKHYDFYSDIEKNAKTFDDIEPGSSKKLKGFLAQAGYQYSIAKEEFMYKNYDSILDFINWRVMKEGRKLPLFKKMNSIVEKVFSSELLRKVLQFQTVLLGTSPYDAPGIYSIMNYVDFVEGVHYPKGGIYELIKALVKIAEKNNVDIRVNSPVEKILVENGKAVGVRLSSGEQILSDIVISNAEYEYTEQTLLDPKYREHDEKYWDKLSLAPSALIMYLGIDGKIDSITHHNLIFSQDWKLNFKQIFENPEWPTDPSIYVSAPSRTDESVAPPGKENLFVLVPIAAGLTYTDEELNVYTEKVVQTVSTVMNIPNLKERIEYKRIYSVKDFERDYHAHKGTALGPAHTLMQTAFFRPNNVSKKVKDLYFVGASTNPGIGMPVCLISSELAYKRIMGITNPHPLRSL